VYSVKARTVDRAGNTEALFTTTAPVNQVSLAVDATRPVVDTGWAERRDASTDTDLTKVHPGRQVRLYATVTEAGSGIPIQVTYNNTTKAITAVLDSKLETTNTASQLGAADGKFLLSPTDPSLGTLLATLKAANAGAGAADGNYWSDGTTLTGIAGNPLGTLTWYRDVTVASTALAGLKAITVKATDDAKPTPLYSLATVTPTIAMTVWTDTGAPALSNVAVTPVIGTQAKAAETVVVSCTATDDFSGIGNSGTTTLTIAGPGGVTVNAAELKPTQYEPWDNSATPPTWGTAVALTSVTWSAVPLSQVASATTLAYTGDFKVRLTLPSATTLTTGSKSLTLTAKDNRAAPYTNSSTAASSIEVVTDRTNFRFNLAEGWNLISMPMPLETPAIETVFADITTVDRVASFWGGESFTATYADGVWDTAGGLTQIEDGKGYLVHATAATTLVVTFAAIDPLTPTPVYDIPAGWNLIGFTSVGLTASTVDADDYLASLAKIGIPTWVVLYRYPGWSQDRPGAVDLAAITGAEGAGMLAIGKGYWLYCSDAGVLVP
jgi:hypothetical protein